MFTLLKFCLFSLLVVYSGPSYAETPPAKKTITQPELPWLDVPGIWSRRGKRTGEGAGTVADGNGNETGGKSGLGSGAGSGSAGKGSGSDAGGSQGDAGAKKLSDGSPGGSVSKSSPGGSVVINKKWWPVCAFVDESVDQGKANSALKGMAEMANACGVTVVFWTRTVKTSSWGGDNPEAINANQVDKCNIPPQLAAAGSTTALVPWAETAAKMCDSKVPKPGSTTEMIWNKDVAGCAQMRSGTSLSKENQDQMKNDAGGEHLSNASGGVAPSIEVPNGHDAGTVAHEAQGHSQMGKPNGTVHGNGIGEDTKKEGEGGAGGGWTGSGCATMYATALDNTQRFSFDPSRLNYYYKPTDPQYYYDIANGPKIFDSNQKFAMNSGSPQLVSSPGQVTSVEDGPPKSQNPSDLASTQPKGGTAKMEDGEEGRRHRPRTVANKLLQSLREVADSEEREVTRSPRNPPTSEPVKPGPRVGYDDSVAKGRSGKGGGGETVTSAEAPPTNIYADDIPDESYAGNAAPSSRSSQASFPAGSGAGASLGYDESAAKGSAALTAGGSTRSFSNANADANRGIVRVGGGFRSASASGDDEMEEEGDFFGNVGEDGQPLRGRRKSLRGRTVRSQKERSAASAEGRALRNRREPASSP